MRTKVRQAKERPEIKRYKIQYPVSAYTFPSETRIHRIRIDDKYLHVELTDGRMVLVPLWWIPTVYNASPEEREKFEISRDRMMIIWDPDKCAINDEVRIADYLAASGRAENSTTERTPELYEAHSSQSRRAGRSARERR